VKIGNRWEMWPRFWVRGSADLTPNLIRIEDEDGEIAAYVEHHGEEVDVDRGSTGIAPRGPRMVKKVGRPVTPGYNGT
jgi:hypothetical protein